MKITGIPQLHLSCRSHAPIPKSPLLQQICRNVHISKKFPVHKVPKGQFPKSRMLGDQLLTLAHQKDIRTGKLLRYKRPSQPITEFSASAIEEHGSETTETFHDLPIRSSFAEKLAAKGITEPTEIQKLAIPLITQGKDTLCAAPTGTGKTLAYMMPLLNKLLEQQNAPNFRKKGQRARAIIIVPTRELAYQTQSVIHSLVGNDLKSFVICGGQKETTETANMNNHMDILIATPERLAMHFLKKHFVLDDLRTVVIDEADSIFDAPFLQDIEHIIVPLKRRVQNVDPLRTQLIIVTATVTKTVQAFIAKHFVKLTQAIVEGLHQHLPKLRYNFIYLETGEKKTDKLLEVLKKRKGQRSMIFCNSTTNCEMVYKMLKKKGYAVSRIHRWVNVRDRIQAFQNFASMQSRVLVCTDLVSRGIDFPEVRHVVLYDFPLNAQIYLHRVGRTARAGSFGRVSALVQLSERTQGKKLEKLLKANKSLEKIGQLKRLSWYHMVGYMKRSKARLLRNQKKSEKNPKLHNPKIE